MEEGERGRSKRQSGRELGVGQEEDESWEGDDSWQAFQGRLGIRSVGDDCIGHHESNSGGQVEGPGAHARTGARKASKISPFLQPLLLSIITISYIHPIPSPWPQVVRGFEFKLGYSVSETKGR